MSTIDLLKQDCAVGDEVSIELISGRNVKGKVVELSNLVKIEQEGGKRISLLESIIGGWDLRERVLSQTQKKLKEDIDDTILFCLEEYMSVIKNSELTARSIIQPNATFLGPSDYGTVDHGIALLKDGRQVCIRKQGFVGNPSVHLKAGAALFVMARPLTMDSVCTIGLMTQTVLNQHFATAMRNGVYCEALAILNYLKDSVPELAGQTVAISSIIDKVEHLKSVDDKTMDEPPLPWYWPFWLKDFIKNQIVGNTALQPISDDEIQSLFFSRFGRRVSIKQIEDLRMEMGISKERVSDEGNRIAQENKTVAHGKLIKQRIYDALAAVVQAVVGDTQSELPTNAQLVKEEDGLKVKVLTDDGLELVVLKSLFIGIHKPLDSAGSRVYVKPAPTDASRVVIQGMTFDELLTFCYDRIQDERYQDVSNVINALRSIPSFASKAGDLKLIKQKIKSAVKLRAR